MLYKAQLSMLVHKQYISMTMPTVVHGDMTRTVTPHSVVIHCLNPQLQPSISILTARLTLTVGGFLTLTTFQAVGALVSVTILPRRCSLKFAQSIIYRTFNLVTLYILRSATRPWRSGLPLTLVASVAHMLLVCLTHVGIFLLIHTW